MFGSFVSIALTPYGRVPTLLQNLLHIGSFWEETMRRVSPDNVAMLLRYSFLEKLKAGLGAAGFVAILSEGVLLPAFVRMIGVAVPFLHELENVGVIVLSISAFFAAALLTDIKNDEFKEKFDLDEKLGQ